MNVSQHEDEVLSAAYYRTLGLKQEEIAQLLGKSIATITRRLRDAQEAGLLQEKIVLNATPEDLKHIYARVSNRRLGRQIEEHFGKRTLQQVIVVPTPSTGMTPAAIRGLLGKSAAVHLASVLAQYPEQQLVGVSFGRTVRAIADASESVADPGRAALNVDFIPLTGGLSALPGPSTGETLSETAEDEQYLKDAFTYSASENALTFAKAFRASASGQLHLPTPAFCPRRYLEGGGTLKHALHFVESIPEYQFILGTTVNGKRDPSALIARLTCAITSVGGPPNSSGEEQGWWLGTRGPLLGNELEAITAEGVIGDICGYFITEDQVSGFSHDSTVYQVNQRLFGPTPDDFRHCARNALLNGHPGVIMVAHHSSKARAVLSAIRNECVSTLIVDDALAHSIIELEPGLGRSQHRARGSQ